MQHEMNYGEVGTAPTHLLSIVLFLTRYNFFPMLLAGKGLFETEKSYFTLIIFQIICSLKGLSHKKIRGVKSGINR